MNEQYDLVVVGAGVLGTFHAYHAVKSGLKVALLEKDAKPQGATVRNFGQITPSKMKSDWQSYGRESLQIYRKIQGKFDISVRKEGSVYLASNDDEVCLLEELYRRNSDMDYNCRVLTKAECLGKYPGLRDDYVKAGLFFSQEMTVEPGVMIHRLHEYLEGLGLDLFFNKTVLECDSLSNGIEVYTADSRSISAAKVIICNGSDFKILYPNIFNESDLIVAKSQMMQTRPQQAYRLPGFVLTGSSIRNSEAFKECPSYAALKSREDKASSERKWGVNISFKQAANGSIIIGSSHEYTAAGNAENLGFHNDMDIDNLILRISQKIIDLPTYDIQKRWIGLYSQRRYGDLFQKTIDRNIHIVTGIGEKGITCSAGFAKENIRSIFNMETA